MRRAGGGLVAALALVALALPPIARAEMTALATRSGSQAPVLSDGRVLWSTRSGKDGIRVFSRLAGGGPVQVVGRAALPSGGRRLGEWTLVAAPTWIGLRVGRELIGGVPGTPLRSVRSGVPAGRTMAAERDTWALPPTGFVTLERGARDRGNQRPRNVVATDASGAHRPVALPPGADPATLAVSGASAAVVVDDRNNVPREVDVLDIATGAVQRRVAMGPFTVEIVISLSLSPEGDLAITGEDGRGSDGLAWAPAGASEFDVQAVDDDFGLVQAARGRIAMVGPNRPSRDGHRVVVFEPRPGDEPPNVLFRGPPANQIEALDFDGDHVAWGIQDSCQLVADATPADSNLIMPPGPCVRTQVWTTTFIPPRLRGAAVGIRFRCLTAATDRCRIDVRALAFPARGGRARIIGVLHGAVPRRAARVLFVPISRRAAARLRAGRDQPGFVYTVIDPDGRRRTQFTL
jgi:hypothetical protein